jgi:hypothetical protein
MANEIRIIRTDKEQPPLAVQILDALRNIINPAKEDGNLASIKSKTDNLDTTLSSRASESTLTQLKDKVGKFPDSNFLTVYSYTENLSDDQVISSNFIDVSYYKWLQIYVKTDKTGQLALIWSDDGVNEDSREFLYPGYEVYQERVKIKSNYLKVEYTNGLATSTFKLIVYAKL